MTVAGACVLRAQDYPFAPIDGPSVKADSLIGKPGIMPLEPIQLSPYLGVPSFLPIPRELETAKQSVAGINAAARNVIESVNRNLLPYRLPDLTPQQMIGLFVVQRVASLFLTPQFSVPYGHIPMTNSSFPFISAKVPDGAPAPYAYKYTPEQFPQAIKSEYDPVTGTYKQVMVDWNEYQKELSRSLGRQSFSTPVPNAPGTPVKRTLRWEVTIP